MSPDRDRCAALLPEMTRWQPQHADRFTLALVSGARVDANRGK